MANINETGTRFSAGRRVIQAGGALAAALLVVSCGTSVKATSDTTNGAAPTTTVAEATTTTAARNAAVTGSDLESVLPVAADLGPDYRTDTDTDSDDSGDFDGALEKACPALVGLVGTGDDDRGRAKAERNFSTEDGRTISVELNAGVTDGETADAEAMAKVVKAANDCAEITFSSSGVDFTGSLKMRTDDEYGDFGALLEMSFTGESDQLPKPLTIRGTIRLFAVGDIGVTLSALGGVDMETLDEIPADTDVANALSARLAKDLAAL